jgi:predicted butyrate kinase (DUF1464 family)
MRTIGIDPGTVSIDVCGLEDGRVFLDRSFPTAQALENPSTLLAVLESAGDLDLVTGPSGYGLPLIRAQALTERDVRLACLSGPGEAGGIGGLGALLRALGRSSLPVIFTPGVIHLSSVPAHRKVNRVDMGTADKVCAAMLAVHDQAQRRGCEPGEVSLVLLELGGAFSAAIAVEAGRIVDGLGGTSGPLGMRAAGALDGEVAFLAGSVTKGDLFWGGVAAVAGTSLADGVDQLGHTARGKVAREAYIESAVKAVATLLVSVPRPFEVVLSGRMADAPTIRSELAERLSRLGTMPVRMLAGIALICSHAAQGAALVADGLAGGRHAALVAQSGLRDAHGTVLDHLYVIDRDAACRRLGIVDG